jgi:hypothetical protein
MECEEGREGKEDDAAKKGGSTTGKSKAATLRMQMHGQERALTETETEQGG